VWAAQTVTRAINAEVTSTIAHRSDVTILNGRWPKDPEVRSNNPKYTTSSRGVETVTTPLTRPPSPMNVIPSAKTDNLAGDCQVTVTSARAQAEASAA
jgi:hypothetical protein